MKRSRSFSAVVYIRTSQEVHRAAAQEAARAKLSLSGWTNSILAAELGVKPPRLTGVRGASLRAGPAASKRIIYVRTTRDVQYALANAAEHAGVPAAHLAEELLRRHFQR